MESHVLKFVHTDFMVCESLVLPFQDQASDPDKYFYYKLYKIGFSTFDAIDLIANHFELNPNSISYAGLKDEDGITEQTIASEMLFDAHKMDVLNATDYALNKYIKLRFVGGGNTKIKIGELSGNAFKVIVRRLSKNLSEQINAKSSYNFFFINYYDTQRFGLPGEPQYTHIIGEALINHKYEEALSFLKNNGSSLSTEAQTFSGDPKNFFSSLDFRKLVFFKNSYASFEWNQQLKEGIIGNCRKLSNLKLGEMEFTYAQDQDEVRGFLSKSPSLSYKKYKTSIEDTNDSLPVLASRPSVIQSQISIAKVSEDEFNDGYHKIEMSFFLPSGCYATNLMRQFVISFEN